MSSYFPIQGEYLDKPSFLRDPFTIGLFKYFEETFNNDSSFEFLRNAPEGLNLDLTTIFDKVAKIENHNLPDALVYLTQENLEELALLYQLVFVSNLTYSNYDNSAYTVSLSDLLSKLNSNKTHNYAFTSKHVQTIVENFFPDDKDLTVTSVNLSEGHSFKDFYGNISPSFVRTSDLVKYWMLPIKNLSELKASIDGAYHKPKFNMINHPFVFAINCAFLHKKIFVLSFDTKSHITFIAKNINSSQMDYANYYSHVKQILSGDLTMEDYVHDFILQNHKLFQRDKTKTAQILYAIHIESQKHVELYVKRMWDSFISGKINSYVMNASALVEEENNKNQLINNNIQVFGWS